MTATVAGSTSERKAFRLERDGDLGILWFDLAGEKINKFSTWVVADLDHLLDEIAAMSEVKRLIIISAKPSVFIAGADIEEFTRVTSADEAEKFTLYGQSVSPNSHGCRRSPWPRSMAPAWAEERS